MTAEELMTIAQIGKGTDMSSYEHFAVAEKSAKRPSGVGIAGLAIGSTALLVGIGAWVFGGVYAAQGAKANARDIDRLAAYNLQDRALQHNWTLNNQPSMQNYIDVAAGGGSAGSNAAATSSAQALAAMMAMSGGYNNGQVNPQPVALYQPAMPCCCPNPCNSCNG